jgi:hypothetical protein
MPFIEKNLRGLGVLCGDIFFFILGGQSPRNIL